MLPAVFVILYPNYSEGVKKSYKSVCGAHMNLFIYIDKFLLTETIISLRLMKK
jgi:hypothetical protein